MAYEQKDNTGSLFANDRRESDNHPTHTGSVLIDGVEYWQSAWVKEAASGKRYFSQSFKHKEARTDKPAAPAQTGEFDDAIPF
jgi:hypothetical protein